MSAAVQCSLGRDKELHRGLHRRTTGCLLGWGPGDTNRHVSPAELDGRRMVALLGATVPGQGQGGPSVNSRAKRCQPCHAVLVLVSRGAVERGGPGLESCHLVACEYQTPCAGCYRGSLGLSDAAYIRAHKHTHMHYVLETTPICAQVNIASALLVDTCQDCGQLIPSTTSSP